MNSTHKCARCPAMIQSGFVCRDCTTSAVEGAERGVSFLVWARIRAATLEEAAAIALATPVSDVCTQDDVERWHAERIAAAIRAAK